MRMRARDVQQAPRQASPGRAVVPAAVDARVIVVLTTVTVAVLMTVAITVDARVIVVLTTVTVTVPVTVLMAVSTVVSTVVLVLVVVMRTAHALHSIQHARINALPHLDNYQGRAVAN